MHFVYLMVFASFLSAANRSNFEKICDSPEVYVCEKFLSDEDCDHIIELAKPSLTRATVVDLSGANNLIDNRRTSYGMFLSPMLKDAIVSRTQKRIAEVTGIPEQNGESFQILHYDVGAEYQPHYDYFDPATPGGLHHFNRGGQRVATFLVYLNTTEEGGETIFPRGKVKVAPVKGKAVLFYNVKPSGEVDPMSFHGGAPVKKGEKWLMSKWIRENVFH